MEHQQTSKAPKAEPQGRSSRSHHVSALTQPAQNTILQLQSQLGYQVVTSVVRSHGIHGKLTVSQHGDPYELEADRVADEMMHMSETETVPSEETRVQTKPFTKHLHPPDLVVTDHALYRRLAGKPQERNQAYQALFQGQLSADLVQEIRTILQQGRVLGTNHFKDAIETALAQRVRPGSAGRPRTSAHPKTHLAASEAPCRGGT